MMITIGNFFFKYRNLLFPIFALAIFIPSPTLFTPAIFGEKYYLIPLVVGLVIAFLGQSARALTIALRYIVRGGKNKKVYAEDLVTGGIFHHVRNPLYIGNILMLTGVGLLSNSMVFVVITVPLFCFIYQCIVLAEEQFLANKFGIRYIQYQAEVSRWVPNFRELGQTLSETEFNWLRYVDNEYNTVYLLFLSIYIVLMCFHPELSAWTMIQKIQASMMVVPALTLIYLIVRQINKSRHRRAARIGV